MAAPQIIQDLVTRFIDNRDNYRGGGAVTFIDVSIGAQVVHYKSGDEPQLTMLREKINSEPAVPYFR